MARVHLQSLRLRHAQMLLQQQLMRIPMDQHSSLDPQSPLMQLYDSLLLSELYAQKQVE
jgi:hypothetical protein